MRPIGKTGWGLAFCPDGRYYFYHQGRGVWTPPQDLHVFLTELDPPLLAALFDPDNCSYDWENLEPKSMEAAGGDFGPEEDVRQDGEEDLRHEKEEGETDKGQEEAMQMVEVDGVGHAAALDKEFERLLWEHANLNPFAPWPEIAKLLNYDGIPVKRQQAIFTKLAPELCARRREERERSREDALTAWLACLQEIRRPLSWTEFSRGAQRRAWWWRQLDPVQMERQFQERMALLRTQQRVYKA